MESIAAAMGVVPKKDQKQRDAQSQTDQTSGVEENASRDIASLAYALWEQQGYPQGSADQDWSRAEELLSRHNVRTASVQGSAEQNWSEAEDQLRRQKIRTASVGG